MLLSKLFHNAREDLTQWKLEPYLHVGSEAVYNPLTDRTIHRDDWLFSELLSLFKQSVRFGNLRIETRQRLISEKWAIALDDATDNRFLLKYVSLEANLACNQSCFFCPVSIDPRRENVMSLDMYEQILRQLIPYRPRILSVFMNHYNEPTIDPFFVKRVELLRKYGFPAALLTNGTGLHPKRVDALVAMGGIRYLSVNLSTSNPETYKRERGNDHLHIVLNNLEYAKNKHVAEDMNIIVLGRGGEDHRNNFRAISERFAGSRFQIKEFPLDSRAHMLQMNAQKLSGHTRLRGCEQTGSRPLQHIHITGQGKCILCCQDYHSEYVIGDLKKEMLDAILQGPRMALYRRWAYGLEEAPPDFICRRCEFALTK